jgi:hypothetical protein
MIVVFFICVRFDLDLSFSSCLRRLELGPLAVFIFPLLHQFLSPRRPQGSDKLLADQDPCAKDFF